MSRFRASLLALISVSALSACATTAPAPTEADAQSLLFGDYLAGRYADMTNDPEAASARYLSALKQAPSDPVLLEGAVESALVAGDMTRALAAANMAKAKNADIGLGRLTLASSALAAGKYSQVPALIEPDNGPPFDRLATRILRAWSLAGENKTDQAIAALGEVSETAPFARVFDYQRALIYQRAGRNEDAIGAYEAAMRTGLRIAPAIVQHGALLEKMGKRDTELSLYRAVLVGGEDPLIAHALARANAGQASDAPAIDKPAVGAAIGFYSLAALLVGQTEPDFYLPYLTLSLALQDDLDSARMLHADALSEASQFDGARRQLEGVAPASPFYERAQVSLMFLLRQQGKDEDALGAARAAVEKTGGKLSRLALADLLRGMENWAEAEPLYSALIAENSPETKEQWRLYFARGAVRERLARWPEAEADLKHALTLSPDQPEVLNYLGYSWIDQGIHLAEGMKLIERAVEAEPDSGYIIDSLGWAHFQLGEYKKAIEYLERAVELSPQDPILNDHLGDAYWRGGRRVEARYQWERSLTLEPTEKDAGATKIKLAQGLPAEPAKRSARAGEPR